MPQIKVLPSLGMSENPSEKAEDALQKSAEYSEMVEASEEIAQLRLNVIDIASRKDGEVPSVENIMAAFDKAIQKIEEKPKTQKASSFIADVIEDIRDELLSHSVEREVSYTLEKRIDLLERAMVLNTEYLKKAPSAYRSVCADFTESLDNSGLPAFVKESFEKKATKEFASAVLKNAAEFDAEKIKVILESPSLRNIFSEEEILLFKDRYQNSKSVKEAQKYFESLEAGMLANAPLEQCEEMTERWVKDNPMDLSDDVLLIIRFFASLFLLKEIQEKEGLLQSEYIESLQEAKRLMDEGKNDALLAHLITSGMNLENPELFHEISENILSGNSGEAGKGSFINYVKKLCEAGSVPLTDLYEAYLKGYFSMDDFKTLLEMTENLGILPGAYFLRKTMEQRVISTQSEAAIYADIMGLYQDYIKASSDGKSVLEIRKMLSDYLTL